MPNNTTRLKVVKYLKLIRFISNKKFICEMKSVNILMIVQRSKICELFLQIQMNLIPSAKSVPFGN